MAAAGGVSAGRIGSGTTLWGAEILKRAFQVDQEHYELQVENDRNRDRQVHAIREIRRKIKTTYDINNSNDTIFWYPLDDHSEGGYYYPYDTIESRTYEIDGVINHLIETITYPSRK